VYFVAKLPLRVGTMLETAVLGASYGLVTYVTYDLTNLATLRDSSVLDTFVDLVWGTVLTAATAAVSMQ
jgi:uncharacterized membrane protein